MMKNILLIIFLFVWNWSVGQVSFESSADVVDVYENATFQVSFTLNNAEGISFRPPAFRGFQVVSGPSSSSSYSNINGIVSSTRSYNYLLLGTKPGAYIIEPAEITVKGKALKTKPLAITVLKSNEPPPKDNRRVFRDKDTYIKLVPSDSTAYIGQQVVLDYKLYTKQNVQSFDLLNEPAYEGFYTNPINQNRRSTQREIVNGEEYYTKVLKSVALFPQQTGTYKINPVVVNIGVPLDDGAGGGFFFTRRLRTLQRVTNSVTIEVTKVPQKAPKSFSGGIGVFTLNASVDNRMVTTDDAIVLNLEIRGDGDPKILQAPKQSFGPELDIYDPNLLRDDSYPDQGRIISYKAYEYLIVPTKPGNFLIRPEFTYFNVDSNKYVTLFGPPKNIVVSQGSRTITKDNRNIEKLNDISESFGGRPTFYASYNSIFSEIGYWLVMGILFVGLLGMIGTKFYLNTRPQLSASEKSRMLAQKIALSKLTRAREFMVENKPREFYDEVSKSLIGYFGDKFHFPLSQMTKDSIYNKLLFENIPAELTEKFVSVINTCEMFLFAGQSSGEMSNIYNDAHDLIIDLDLTLEGLGKD